MSFEQSQHLQSFEMIGSNSKYRQSPYKQSQRKSILPRDSQDPFNLIQLEDLLQGVNDWRNIQDILRKTIKCLVDTVKIQGEAIQSIDNSLIQKASVNELQAGLLEKANTSDVNRNLADLTQSLDQKVAYDECKMILKEEQLVSENKLLKDLNRRLDDLQQQQNRTINQELQYLQQQIVTKASNQEINEILETKATKQHVAAALQNKADRNYVDTKLGSKADNLSVDQLLTVIEGKVDFSALEKVMRQVDQKADKQENEIQQIKVKGQQDDFSLKIKELTKQHEILNQRLDDYKFDLNNKAESKEMEKVYQKVVDNSDKTNKIDLVQRDFYINIDGIKQDMQDFQNKIDHRMLNKDQSNDNLYRILRDDVLKINDGLAKQAEEIREDLQENVKLVRNIANSVKTDIVRETQILGDDLNQFKAEYALNQIDKEEYLEFKNRLTQVLEDKVDLEEVQNALNAQQKDISQRFQEHKQDIKRVLNDQEKQNLAQLQKMVTLDAFEQILLEKADKEVVETALAQKVNHQTLDKIKQKIESIYDVLDKKLDSQQFNHYFKDLLNDVKEMKENIALKVDQNSVAQMLDEKADFTDIQTTIRDIQMELDKKALQDSVSRMNRDQAIINESLCTENIVGRWMWKSGMLKTGSHVPWEVQIVNTLPDNFLWEKDKASILVCAPGLYEIMTGFFSKKKPSVQININGEPIISAVNKSDSSRYREHKHSSGQLTGLNIREVIIVPQRARVTVMYNGDSDGEGFLSFKRL